MIAKRVRVGQAKTDAGVRAVQLTPDTVADIERSAADRRTTRLRAVAEQADLAAGCASGGAQQIDELLGCAGDGHLCAAVGLAVYVTPRQRAAVPPAVPDREGS